MAGRLANECRLFACQHQRHSAAAPSRACWHKHAAVTRPLSPSVLHWTKCRVPARSSKVIGRTMNRLASSSVPVSRVPIAPASRAVAVSSSSSGQLHSYRSLQKCANQHCKRRHSAGTKWSCMPEWRRAGSMALLGAPSLPSHVTETLCQTMPSHLQQAWLTNGDAVTQLQRLRTVCQHSTADPGRTCSWRGWRS